MELSLYRLGLYIQSKTTPPDSQTRQSLISTITIFEKTIGGLPFILNQTVPMSKKAAGLCDMDTCVVSRQIAVHSPRLYRKELQIYTYRLITSQQIFSQFNNFRYVEIYAEGTAQGKNNC